MTGPRAGSRPISWDFTITGPQRRNLLVETEICDCRDGQQVRTHINEQDGTKTVFPRLYTGYSLFFGYICLFYFHSKCH